MHRLGWASPSSPTQACRQHRRSAGALHPGGALLGTSRVSSMNSLSRASWPCRSTRPGCEQPGTPADSMNECSCCTADELVLVPSGGAPGRVASTARRHMHADNAGVKRLNYTRESIPAAGGQQFDLVAVGVFD